MTTVGVTGTNGKTSTTWLVTHALRASGWSVAHESTIGCGIDGRTFESTGTLEGFLGLMRRAREAGCRHAVVETTSEALARGYAKLWRFDVGVFTNLTHDHLATHGSWEHYLASKAQLFLHLGPGNTAVLNAADPACLLLDQVTPKDVTRRWYAVPARGAVVHETDLLASHVVLSTEGTRVELEPSALSEQLGGVLEVRLIGAVFAENALAAALGALGAGADAAHVREGLRCCPQVPGRFELVSRSPIVVVDYAHTPDALARVCDTARSLAGAGRVLVVFGAGGERDREKRRPMGEAVGARADVAVVTNDNPRSEAPRDIARAVAAGCRRGGRARVLIELDRARAIEAALSEARRTDVVVIAGKGHEKTQTIGDEVRPFSDVEVARTVLGSGRGARYHDGPGRQR